MSVLGLTAAQTSRLRSLPAPALAEVLAVFTGEGSPGQPAILGTRIVDDAGLHFAPRFPFVPGMKYTARVRLEGAKAAEPFEIPASDGSPPRVVAVFPSGRAIPENTLRLYLHFSKPMNARSVHRHLRLLNQYGVEIDLAFVEVEHGLWDAGQARLTLLFHPGRVKRGVGPGENLGPVLTAGSSYRLIVDRSLSDVEGRALGADFEHRFDAVPADRVSPSIDDIRLAPPREPDGALAATLPEALDEGMLRRFIWIEDSAGESVAGEIAISDGETRWTFRPEPPWKEGAYALRVHPALEDRAGNRFDRLFDRESSAAHPGDDASVTTLRVPFSVP